MRIMVTNQNVVTWTGWTNFRVPLCTAFWLQMVRSRVVLVRPTVMACVCMVDFNDRILAMQIQVTHPRELRKDNPKDQNMIRQKTRKAVSRKKEWLTLVLQTQTERCDPIPDIMSNVHQTPEALALVGCPTVRSVEQRLVDLLAEAHLPELDPDRLDLARRVHRGHILGQLSSSGAVARQPVYRLSRLFRQVQELLRLQRGWGGAFVSPHVAPAALGAHDELVGPRGLLLPVLSEVPHFASSTGLDEMGAGLHEEALAEVVGLRDELVAHCEDFGTSFLHRVVDLIQVFPRAFPGAEWDRRLGRHCGAQGKVHLHTHPSEWGHL